MSVKAVVYDDTVFFGLDTYEVTLHGISNILLRHTPNYIYTKYGVYASRYLQYENLMYLQYENLMWRLL